MLLCKYCPYFNKLDNPMEEVGRGYYNCHRQVKADGVGGKSDRNYLLNCSTTRFCSRQQMQYKLKRHKDLYFFISCIITLTKWDNI